VWWIVSQVSAGLVTVALLIGSAVVFSRADSHISASDFVQFASPLLTLSFGSVLYFNVRHMLLRWPDELMRMWRSGLQS